jgi:hypothetical protein
MAMTAPFYAAGGFGEQTGFVIIVFVGLAFGFSRKELGIDDEMISSRPLLEKHLEVVQ